MKKILSHRQKVRANSDFSFFHGCSCFSDDMVICSIVEGSNNKPVAAPDEDERADNSEPVKLAAAVGSRSMIREPITPPPGEFLLHG
jgi:hypothetical protein